MSPPQPSFSRSCLSWSFLLLCLSTWLDPRKKARSDPSVSRKLPSRNKEWRESFGILESESVMATSQQKEVLKVRWKVRFELVQRCIIHKKHSMQSWWGRWSEGKQEVWKKHFYWVLWTSPQVASGSPWTYGTHFGGGKGGREILERGDKTQLAQLPPDSRSAHPQILSSTFPVTSPPCLQITPFTLHACLPRSSEINKENLTHLLSQCHRQSWGNQEIAKKKMKTHIIYDMIRIVPLFPFQIIQGLIFGLTSSGQLSAQEPGLELVV